MIRLAATTTVLFRAGVLLAFAVVIVAITIQVFSRNFLPVSPAWTEELTRFALLYLAAFGIGLAFRSGDLVNVDMAVETLPERAAWMFRLIGAVIVCAMALMLLEPAWRFAGIGRMQTSPVLGIRMTWSHGAMVALLAGLAVFSALRVFEMLTGRHDGRPIPLDAAEPEASIPPNASA
jgi:TRAP-type C4-dicarboxylate transport system permease small subunit